MNSQILNLVRRPNLIWFQFTRFFVKTFIFSFYFIGVYTSGHVFAFGESRTLAIANMVLGLKEIQIRGEIRTNVDYTIDLLHVSIVGFQNCNMF